MRRAPVLPATGAASSPGTTIGGGLGSGLVGPVLLLAYAAFSICWVGPDRIAVAGLGDDDL